MKYYGNELYHHGVLGQKWGVRRYQNKDGSYTSAGAAENGGHGRYADEVNSAKNKVRDAKRELKKSKAYQARRDLIYGNFGRLTKEGRRTSAEIKENKKKLKDAKSEYKSFKADSAKKAVGEFMNVSKKADKIVDELDSEYTKLFNIKDKKSSEYISTKKKVQELSARLDAAYADPKYKEAYKNTGRNIFERVSNNIKYQKYFE